MDEAQVTLQAGQSAPEFVAEVLEAARELRQAHGR
jgi:hypothetical protein